MLSKRLAHQPVGGWDADVASAGARREPAEGLRLPAGAQRSRGCWRPSCAWLQALPVKRPMKLTDESWPQRFRSQRWAASHLRSWEGWGRPGFPLRLSALIPWRPSRPPHT